MTARRFSDATNHATNVIDATTTTAVVAVAGFSAAAGGYGTAIGVLLVVAAALVPVVYVVAAGHFLLLAAAPEFTMAAITAVEVSCLALLAGRTNSGYSPLALVVLAASLFAITGGVYVRTDAFSTAGLALTGTVAFAAYALHRYERVALGLVEADR